MTPLIVCIKVGTKYSADYVNRLAAGVARHTTRPYEFLCLTDDPTGVECQTAPIETDLPGWWAKLVLFKPHSRLVDRRVVFLDLDTVIVSNMDFLLEYDGQFAILRDFYHADQMGSAVMSIAPGVGLSIWHEFPGIQAFWGDQAWIQASMKQADRWQDLYPNKIVSYKVHCEFDLVPPYASIVCFHGQPRPHQVAELPFMQEHWHDRTPVAR